MNYDDTINELTAQKMSQGLRELADFLDEQPEFLGHPYFSILKHVDNREQFLELARKLGTFEKEVSDEHYNLNRMFGPIKLQVYCERDVVCTKRIVTKTIEVEEWNCPEHLLSGNGEKESVDATPRN